MSGHMLVFRKSTKSKEPALPMGTHFVLVDALPRSLRIAGAYASEYGLCATIKMFLKIASRARVYYAAIKDGRIVSDGWMTRGKCLFYHIERNDWVIGPIWSTPDMRGQGLAYGTLVRGANACLERGASWVYIDTTCDNIASLKTIAKSGFERQ